MTATAVPRVRLTSAAPARALLPALAAQETRRLLLHPVMLVAFAICLVAAGDAVLTQPLAREAFEAVGSLVSFYPGMFAILAANLVATRDVRAGSADLLGPLPGRPVERVAALCLAALVPALICLVLVAGLDAYFLADGRFVEAPSAWHVLQGPVTVAGACLLGIMLGVWAPARGTAVIALVAMVAVNVWLAGLGDDGRLFGPMMAWAAWGPGTGDAWAGLLPGSPAGHVVYLVGLCGLAGSAALLRVADRRTPVVLLGLASVAVSVAGGIGQLP
jgi:hypothetical protein